MPEMGVSKVVTVAVMTTTQRDALAAVEGMIIFNSTTDQLEEYDGSTWQAVGQVILTTHEADYDLHNKVVRKSANETVTNSTTLQNDNELKLAIGASEVWKLHFLLRIISPAAADFDFKITVPSGASGNGIAECQGSRANVGVDAEVLMLTLGISEGLVIDIVVVNGTTAGNVQLQWAQHVADAGDTIVYANSSIIATQLV